MALRNFLPAWLSYLLEIAPETERPVYVGLNNTINGVSTIISTLGGLLLQWTGNNYALLFAITVVGTALALPLTARLAEPREA